MDFVRYKLQSSLAHASVSFFASTQRFHTFIQMDSCCQAAVHIEGDHIAAVVVVAHSAAAVAVVARRKVVLAEAVHTMAVVVLRCQWERKDPWVFRTKPVLVEHHHTSTLEAGHHMKVALQRNSLAQLVEELGQSHQRDCNQNQSMLNQHQHPAEAVAAVLQAEVPKPGSRCCGH